MPFKKNNVVFLKNILLHSIIFLITSNSYSLEVGDKFELRKRMLAGNRIVVKKYIAEITDYDQSSNKFYLKSENYYPFDIYRNLFEAWFFELSFPTKEQISSLLENCETLGWKKGKLELLDPSTGKKNLKEVCITTRELFMTWPFQYEADVYYYGHFPIYGIGKMEIIGPPREVFYLKNLIF